MKKILLLLMLTVAVVIQFSCVALATSTPFEYNIIPKVKNLSTIDSKVTKSLSFELFEHQDDIYWEDKKVSVVNDSFTINTSNIVGKKEIVFKNSLGEKSTFTYFFSDKKGKLNDYELVAGKSLNTFVTTYKNIKIVYTDKESKALAKLKANIDKMPQKMLANLYSIKMIPYSNTSNIAGTTKDGQITLYNYSKYDNVTQKNIIFHETAHTFANSLIDKKIIDYDYTNYNEIVLKDNTYVSKYSKNFADAIAFYLINQKSFKKSYPARFEYIKNLLS